MAGETSLYQEQWDSRLMQVYQQKGFLLKGMTMPPSKIEGKKLHFNIIGKGEAQDYTVRDKVKTMNLIKGEVSMDAQEWDAADYIFQYDLDRMPVDTKDATVQAAAMALGRKHDKNLYSKMWARSTAGTFGTTVPKIGENMIVGAFANAAGPLNFIQGRRKLWRLDAPIEDGGLYVGVPTIVWDTLMSYNTFANSQWRGGTLPWSDNGMRRTTWQNWHMFELPADLENVSGTDGKFYGWHRSALGTGFTGEEIRTGWKYELDWKRWYYQSTLSAGALIIEEASTGHVPPIVEFRYKADAEPTYT